MVFAFEFSQQVMERMSHRLRRAIKARAINAKWTALRPQPKSFH